MAHVIDEEIFCRLSEEKQEKIVNIYHIADILAHYNCPPLNEADFDRLYDLPLLQLENYTIHYAHKYQVPRPSLKPMEEQRKFNEEGD